jgi:UDP-N-acetylglucosamine--N-acetylmuramyl-(pentapeptide) pyrophosphoryl-undecaprenol N-acetylglucosamine transferase
VVPLRAIFAGGGTGGHLFPAIAIADELGKMRPGAEILFVGTKDKIEARVVPRRGYPFRSIWISGFHRKFRVENIIFPVKVVVSLMQAHSIIKEFNPQVVVGTGGYVCGPVVRAAVMRHIPTLLQEQNSYPGVTTRVLADKVDEVHLTFDRSREYLRRTAGVFVSGNPTRSDLETAGAAEAAAFFGFDPAVRATTLLVFGGSLGAESLNRAVERNIAGLMDAGFRLIWQTGSRDYERALALARAARPSGVYVGAFIDRMDYAYGAADLVISRAGATTVAELMRLGKPSILVPYPHAAADHQRENARALVDAGAAVLVEDAQIGEILLPKVRSLLVNGVLREMAARSRALGRPDAASVIARHVCRLAER